MSQWFEVSQGVRKGCVLSPMPFNKFLDRVIRQAMVSWRSTHAEHLCTDTYSGEGRGFAAKYGEPRYVDPYTDES